MTNSARLAVAITTRLPATRPSSPSPAATRDDRVVELAPRSVSPPGAGVHQRDPVRRLGGGAREELGEVRGHTGESGTRVPQRWRRVTSGQPTAAGAGTAQGPRAERSRLAGEAAFAVREVESSLRAAGRPDAPRRSSTSTTRSSRARRSSTSPAGCTAASSSPPGTSSAPPGSRPTSASSGSRTPSTSPRPAAPRWPSSRATASRSSRRSARRSSTSRWPSGSGPAPGRWPRCTSTRGSGSGWSPRRRSRSPRTIARRLGPHRRARHGRRARRRRLHRPARRRHAARPGEGGRGAGARRAGGARPEPLLGVLRLPQRPADADASSATPA